MVEGPHLDDFDFQNQLGPFSSRNIIWLEDQKLCWSGKGERSAIDFSDVAEIRLLHYVAQGKQSLQVEIRSTDGTSLKYRSLDYLSPGRFQDRSIACTPFTKELINRTHKHNVGTKFCVGSDAHQFIWAILSFGLVALVGLMAFLAHETGKWGDIRLWLVAAFGIALLPFAVRQILTSRATEFDPLNPPL